MNETRPSFPNHPIERFCTKRGLSKSGFALRCGIARIGLYRVMWGDDEVGTDLFEAIEHGSGGALLAEDLFAIWRRMRRVREAQLAARSRRRA
jgi:hypothetical protein